MAAQYNRKDHLYLKAKKEGYRSRAAYKLIELDDKYRLLLPGMHVLDLGAWPGSWLEVEAERIGKAGLAVGIDLVKLDELSNSNVTCLCGDAGDDEILAEALRLSGEPFDLILSDMSPKLTGIAEADRYGAVHCAELALYGAGRSLRAGGNFVIKVFKSNETEVFVKSLRPLFNKVIRAELSSTRKTSNEFYVLGQGFKPGLHS